MGKPGDRHRSWFPEADPSVRVRAGLVPSWVHQGASLRRGLPESAAGDVQPAGNGDEEFLNEAESAGVRSARSGRTCAAGIGGDEQGFLSGDEIETLRG